MHTTYEQIGKVLSKNFFINPLAVQPTKKFNRDLGLSSLEFLEMVMIVENAFGIAIADERLERIQTVKQMADCVDKLRLAEA